MTLQRYIMMIWVNAGKYSWSEARHICTLFSRHWRTPRIIIQNKMLEQNSSFLQDFVSSRFRQCGSLGGTPYPTEISEIACQLKLSSGLAMACHQITFWPKQSAAQVPQDMDYSLELHRNKHKHGKYSNYFGPNVSCILHAQQSLWLDTRTHTHILSLRKKKKKPNCIHMHIFISFFFFH